MRLYLAHALRARHYVRRMELWFEARTGIELVNPFYDASEREDIAKIDSGKQAPYGPGLDPVKIVEGDLKTIDACDGVLGYVKLGMPSIGTYIELWYAYTKGKPVYVMTKNWANHPWLRYIVTKSGGFIVTSWEQAARKLHALT